MEILDPDLWNDDGTPKRPSQQYMDSLEAVHTHNAEAYLNYARIKREAKAARSPEVGDIVHFWEAGDPLPACRASIVMETDAFGDGALLRVHVPHRNFRDEQCAHDEDKEFSDTWHWPCGEGR